MQIFRVKKPSCKILKTKNCVPFDVKYYRSKPAFTTATQVKSTFMVTLDKTQFNILINLKFPTFMYYLCSSPIFITIPSSHKHVLTCRVENCVNSDQLASQKPADLDLHSFKNRI